MRRRALLASVGTLSAGCLGASPPRANGSRQTHSDRTPTTTAETTCETETERPDAASSDGTESDGEYRVTGLETATSVDRPAVRYVLEPSAYYSADAVEREAERTGEERVVRDVSELDGAVRDAVEEAARTGEWRSNELPDGLADAVERVDFFTGVSEDGTDTHVGFTLYAFDPDGPPAIEFDARVVDDAVSAESPGAVEFELRNASQTTQRVFSGTVPPFGMVFAEAVEGDGEFLLWREYEEEGCIGRYEGGWTRCDIGIVTELRPCESVTRRYEVLPSGTDRYPDSTVPPGPGAYRADGSVEYYEDHGAPESKLSYEVRFTLESA